jgi:hypothetical protein
MSLGKSETTFDKYSDNKIVSGINKCVDDSDIIKKKLPIYDAIPCIDNLLKQVVKANHRFYDTKKYFYSLSFKKEGAKRYLVIESGQYKSSRVLDYIGVIKISGAIFLCRGDITTDTLFKISNNTFLTILLQGTKDSEYIDYGFEPILSGLYQECTELKIYLEIYTRATLPGYKMNEQINKKPRT